MRERERGETEGEKNPLWKERGGNSFAKRDFFFKKKKKNQFPRGKRVEGTKEKRKQPWKEKGKYLISKTQYQKKARIVRDNKKRRRTTKKQRKRKPKEKK